MKISIILLTAALFSAAFFGRLKTIQERPGYSKDAKRLIIHERSVIRIEGRLGPRRF